MTKKTIAYLSLSLIILIAALYLKGYRLTRSSIYNEHAKSYMSSTYTVLFENDDFGIVEFEGITEIIYLEKTLFLYRDSYESGKSIDYPFSNTRFKDYTTYNQIIHSKRDPYTIRRGLSENDTEKLSDKIIGYTYVYNSTNSEIEFKSWDAITDSYESISFERIQLNETSELLYSNAFVSQSTNLLAYANGKLIQDNIDASHVFSGYYMGKSINNDHLIELLNLPYLHDNDKLEEDFLDITPLITIDEKYEDFANSNQIQTYYYYIYDNDIYMKMYNAYYRVSKSLFQEILQKIELTHE